MRKPPLEIEPTTLWDYPSQHYGEGMQGDRNYVGATPSYVIWNLLKRYTREGDLVVDPFCGSGTTLDVARDLNRQARGFDVHPYRPDIENADARHLPLEDASVDFWFADPPYSDNIHYSDDPRCIGKLKASEEAYFEALEACLFEAHRVLRDRRYLAVYICDVFSKREGFVPIGLRVLAMALPLFKPIDHIAVVRHNRTLSLGNHRKAAVEGNFYLRGFNHLLILKKELPEGGQKGASSAKVTGRKAETAPSPRERFQSKAAPHPEHKSRPDHAKDRQPRDWNAHRPQR